MATFQNRVEAQTQFAFGGSTDPSVAELTEFVNDGIVDVTEKWLVSHPQDRGQFTRVSGEVINNGSEKVARANIISVVRESGTNNDWRPCRQIPPVQQTVVTDADSLFFASKYNPAYMIAEDGVISVFPVPGKNFDAFKVYYVNNDPRDSDGNSVTYSTSELSFFPKDKVYLVVLYASIKTLEAVAGSKLAAQDIELQQSFGQLSATFKAEYVAAFQPQQQQQGAQPRR